MSVSIVSNREKLLMSVSIVCVMLREVLRIKLRELRNRMRRARSRGA